MEFKKSNNVDNGTTKKRIIDFELYGVIAICKSFKKCSKEVFKHALYDNTYHFHEVVNTYDDFDEKKYIINCYIKNERIKSPGKPEFDILEEMLFNFIEDCNYTHIAIFSNNNRDMFLNQKKSIFINSAFKYARSILEKDESRILDYDFSTISDSSYISEVAYVIKWLLPSTYDRYMHEYTPRALNEVKVEAREESIEEMEYRMLSNSDNNKSTDDHNGIDKLKIKVKNEKCEEMKFKCPNCNETMAKVKDIDGKPLQYCPKCKSVYRVWMMESDE